MGKNTDFSNIRRSRFLRRFVSLLLMYCLSECTYASAPFITDDAEVTDYHRIQSYLYSADYSGSDAAYLILPAGEIDYGFIKNGEIDLTVQILSYIPSQGKTETGLGDTQATFKYVVMNESANWPQIAIAPALWLPTGSVPRNLGWGKTWYTLPLWVEKRWGAWTTYGGGGYTINPSQDAKNFIFGGWVLQRNITEQLALGLEIYSQGAAGNNNAPVAGAFTVVNLGASYNLNTFTSLLLSAGHNVSGISLWYGYLGFYFTMS